MTHPFRDLRAASPVRCGGLWPCCSAAPAPWFSLLVQLVLSPRQCIPHAWAKGTRSPVNKSRRGLMYSVLGGMLLNLLWPFLGSHCRPRGPEVRGCTGDTGCLVAQRCEGGTAPGALFQVLGISGHAQPVHKLVHQAVCALTC